VYILCSWKLIIQSLPSNTIHFWLQYSSFQTSCHSAVFLVSLLPGSLQSYRCSPTAPRLGLLVTSRLSQVVRRDIKRKRWSYKSPFFKSEENEIKILIVCIDPLQKVWSSNQISVVLPEVQSKTDTLLSSRM
jgi:hypothetical protein